MSSPVPPERLEALRQRRERVNVELRAVEDGTLPWLEEHPGATPKDLAEAFGLTAPAANNRLRRLEGVGLARRVVITHPTGGLGYRYFAEVPNPKVVP